MQRISSLSIPARPTYILEAAHGSYSHNFAISPCRTEGDKVATLHPIQINSLTEYIRRLTDGPYDIISLNRRIRSDILYLMERLVECRTNQIRHAGIQNGKLLVGALLHIKHLRNQ